jgi:hypothetical protein
MDALRVLDGLAAKYGKTLPHYKRVLARKSVSADVLKVRRDYVAGAD